ncbi:MAG: Fe-S protein assembly chaperone HscA [Pseudomonas sp.]|jgi:molecular chaperone HscA|uniref:Fe-S protein assembly chaperone HscA n=1 Tax=Stutzerimonas frequens TaxID=2968969 RepID=UPI0007BA09CE|nr:Fe-S protein assembly chaperone HscA [Stutzerimonas frequens]MAL90174.1 Fe-S protein assembly chaperone HscA [Pseudomonas sp.]MEC7474162.1 Fe-S protein assembly chaperone HscA [Pseudomonadota bacterium]KZX56342.1 Fe-S protein assembly chaperone HscA [Stutzerimonas frequens]MBA4725262.1 Fe-S protein assembly chaperone HscA [Pseudomonas sp.]MBK3916066.1 Fe-S protein assembly chaperone HscA [Stutzerimonas frequens]|tara:strand:+ start:12486 stop:14348 length:1863 start_codon:yes stop_codon:yes gene_type:complete
MALLQIAEPGQSPQPHQRRLAVGIDLGTTNSLVAALRSGITAPLPDAEGQVILPSVVRYHPDYVEVGAQAKLAAASDPFNTISSIKRLMGRGLADVKQLGEQLPYRFREGESQMPFIETVQGARSPVEVSAEILRTLRQRAEASLGGELVGAVITVPAYFDDAQRQATKDAARIAGLNVLRLLNEPTAAAVAYGLDRQAEGVVAIYDLGGGTFDISILRLTKGVFEVLATGGDTALGGDDFDHAVADWIVVQAGVSGDLTPGSQRELLKLACDAKERLSSADAVTINYAGWSGELRRETFDSLIEPLVARSLKSCRRAVRDSGVELEEITAVVMVGGSTRVPRVRSAVGQLFGREPLTDIDPDEVVAIGAAIQAETLAGNNRDGEELLLLDVIPLSLGLETMGGLMEKIIPRNTTIPVARAQDFTTYKDGQTAMMIHVLQGERELIADCRSLARFELRGIPPMVAGAAKIRVTFQVDADGLLSVSARELASGVEANIQVKPSYGLTDGEIARMLEDSFRKADDDRHARALREQLVEAQRLLEAVEAALEADGERLLAAEERAAIEAQMEELRTLLDSQDVSAIERQTKRLSQITDAFAARRLDSTVKAALAGRRLNDIED